MIASQIALLTRYCWLHHRYVIQDGSRLNHIASDSQIKSDQPRKNIDPMLLLLVAIILIASIIQFFVYKRLL